MADRHDRVAPQPADPSARSARGARTRRRIAEADLCLLVERATPPTATDIADRAGVSLRLIFHHFTDLDAVHRAAGELCVDRFRALDLEVPSDLALATRIERTVHRRADLYESIGNLARNAATLGPGHPGVAAAIAHAHAVSVQLLERTFAPELRAAGRGRKEVVGSLAAAASWQLWDQLRRTNALSVTAARRVVVRMLQAAVAEAA